MCRLTVHQDSKIDTQPAVVNGAVVPHTRYSNRYPTGYDLQKEVSPPTVAAAMALLCHTPEAAMDTQML